jgi:hypothetical protein
MRVSILVFDSLFVIFGVRIVAKLRELTIAFWNLEFL